MGAQIGRVEIFEDGSGITEIIPPPTQTYRDQLAFLVAGSQAIEIMTGESIPLSGTDQDKCLAILQKHFGAEAGEPAAHNDFMAHAQDRARAILEAQREVLERVAVVLHEWGKFDAREFREVYADARKAAR